MNKMPRSFLIKKTNNYSNCPLKKRPYKELQDDDKKDDNSEPENLSTKPEDLSITSQNHYPHKTITPPPAIAIVTSAPVRPVTPAPHYLGKTSGGPLEPLNLNTPAEAPHHPYATTWHRPTTHVPTAHYPPPAYYYHPYTPTEMYHQYSPVYPVSPTARHAHHQEQQLSPYAPRDSTGSPPNHMLTPFRSSIPVVASLPHRQHQAAELPKLYMPYQNVDHCGLSPTSSIASSSSNTAFQSLSPPPVTPEDLSSPGSVSSGSSSGSTSAGKKRKEGVGAISGPRYQCPDCAKSYSTYSGLSKHQQFHCAATTGAQAKKSFSCKYCEKVYVSLGALKMHIRTHTLPCKCKLCGKAFSRPWLLQGHIRTHTGEKPFSCPHCNRAFADRSNLRAHLQTHSDVKKYSCTTCSKTFSRMSLLTKHMDGGCPGTGVTTTAPPLVSAISHLILGNGIQRDSTSGDEAKVYH